MKSIIKANDNRVPYRFVLVCKDNNTQRLETGSVVATASETRWLCRYDSDVLEQISEDNAGLERVGTTEEIWECPNCKTRYFPVGRRR